MAEKTTVALEALSAHAANNLAKITAELEGVAERMRTYIKLSKVQEQAQMQFTKSIQATSSALAYARAQIQSMKKDLEQLNGTMVNMGTAGISAFKNVADGIVGLGDLGNKTMQNVLNGFDSVRNAGVSAFNDVVNEITNLGNAGDAALQNVLNGFGSVRNAGVSAFNDVVNEIINLGNAGDAALQSMLNGFNGVQSAGVSAFNDVVNEITNLGNAGDAALQNVLNGFGSVRNAGVSAFNDVVNEIINLGNAGDAALQSVLNGFNGVQSAGASAFNTVVNEVMNLRDSGSATLQVILDAFNGVGEAGTATFEGVVNGITHMGNVGMSALQDVLNGFGSVGNEGNAVFKSIAESLNGVGSIAKEIMGTFSKLGDGMGKSPAEIAQGWLSAGEAALGYADAIGSYIMEQQEAATEREIETLDNKIAMMEEERDHAIAMVDEQGLSEEEALKKKAAIEERYNAKIKAAEEEKVKKKHELAVKQFNYEKGMAIANALISMAMGIANAWATPQAALSMGVTAGIMTALVVGATAAQIGIIASQSPPALAKGGIVPAQAGGGLYTLGEAGKAETVLPFDVREFFARPVRGFGGTSVVVNVHGDVFGEEGKDMLAQAVQDGMERLQNTRALEAY